MKTRAVLLLVLLLAVRVQSAPALEGDSAQPSREEATPVLTGTIMSRETGEPLSGALVEVLPYHDTQQARERHAARDFTQTPLAVGSSDVAGRFRIAVPAAREVVVTALAPGHARSRFRGLYRTGTGSIEQDLGRLSLPEGRSVAGRVIDAQGQPVPRATVIAGVPRSTQRFRGAGASLVRRFSAVAPARSYPVTTETGADGSFRIDHVPASSLALRAYAEGLAPAIRRNVRKSSGITLKVETGHSMKGLVVAPDGKTPVAGSWVVAGEEGWGGVARTDEQGRFVLENLARGSTTLVASLPRVIAIGGNDALPASAMWADSAPRHTTIPPAGDTPAQPLRLRPGGVIRVRALDSESRLPVSETQIVLDAPGESRPRRASTGETGEVVFTGVPVGSADLRAEAPGFLEEEIPPVRLASRQDRSITIAMRAAAAIAGTVRDSAGRPIVGAEISVAGPPPMARSLPVKIYLSIGLEPVTSDSQGRFLLEKLPPRTDLQISVAFEGYVSWEISDIKLRPGETRSGMEILMDAGAAISGRLVDIEGGPIQGAGISATRRREGNRSNMMIVISDRPGRGGRRGGGRLGGGTSLQPVFTDENGVFRVRGTKPGVWSIDIKARGFAPQKLGGLKLEEGSDLDTGDVVMEPGVLIRGYVTSRSGEAIPFAQGVLRQQMFVLSRFTTGPDGSFVSDDLAPGDLVDLTIEADGYASAEQHGLSGPIDDLLVEMVPSSRVSGEVIDEESREPVWDFGITISRSRTMGGGGMRFQMAMLGPETPFHSEDGTFTVDEVDPGKITVKVTAPGYRETIMSELEIPEGEDLEGLRLMMQRAASVSGRVLDDNGRPVAGASVSKKEMSGGRGMMMAGGGDSGTSTDGDGYFLLDGLDRGPLTISFKHQEYETAEVDVDTSRNVEDLRVTMSRGAELSGIVLHADDGTPISGATVIASVAGSDRFTGSTSATTGPDGEFLIDALSPGRYSVRAEATGLKAAQVDDIVISSVSVPSPLELRMEGGVTLMGQITGVKEEDLPSFTVSAIRSGGGFGVGAAVDATGRFEMGGLSSGTMTLVARSGIFGGRTMSRTVAIPENATTFETTIEFPPGSTVEGTVTKGGVPMDGATVIFVHSASRTSVTAKTDIGGNYTAEDLDEGDYDVTVLHFKSGLSHTTQASIIADKRFDIELPLARIDGFVTDTTTGEPIDGVTISIKKTDGTKASGRLGMLLARGAETDDTGYYAIDGLDDGTYMLTASGPGYGYENRPTLVAPGLQSGEVSFVLSPTEGLAFRAADSSSGLPLKSLSAIVLVGGGDPLAPGGSGASVVFQGRLSADASGIFRLDSLQPGTYRLVLGGQGLGTRTLNDVEVPAAEQVFSMEPGGTLEIRAESLRAGETAKAVLLDDRNRPVHVATLFPDPAFTLRGDGPTVLTHLPAGSFLLRATLPNGQVKESAVSVTPGQTAELTLP